jgi:hypothetical protein
MVRLNFLVILVIVDATYCGMKIGWTVWNNIVFIYIENINIKHLDQKSRRRTAESFTLRLEPMSHRGAWSLSSYKACGRLTPGACS